MEILDLTSVVRKLDSFQEEIAQYSTASKQGMLYSLRDYLEIVHHEINWVDHGEQDRFYHPFYVATIALNSLLEIDSEKFNSAISTNKKRLVSIISRYSKAMKNGFLEYEFELRA